MSVVSRKSPPPPDSRTYYEIFGRRNGRHALQHLGYILAPNEEYARSHAMKVYDEYRWIEFVMVRREHFIPVDGDPTYQIGVV